MITKLTIKNYALIDDISVNFSSGFTTITGETGAGKSILLGALSLLLGKRADLTSVKDISKKCIIEAEFRLEKDSYEKLFLANDLDFDLYTIIRRELLPSGKSRAFVNDTPVTLQQLQAVAPFLADIHNQHDTLSLFSETFQMELLDVLAKNSTALKEYQTALHSYNEISETIAQLEYKKETETKELDYNTFLYNELIASNLEKINIAELEEAFETLSHSELIIESLSKSNQLLHNEQIGSLETLKEVRNSLSKLKSIASNFEDLWNRIDSVIIELEDISASIDETENTIEVDPVALTEINDTLQNIYKLQQKHSLDSVEDLVKLQHTLEQKIENTTSLDSQILQYKKEQKDTLTALKKAANILYKKRVAVIPILIKKTTLLLKDLGLPNAQLKIELTESKQHKNNGLNNIEILFTANKGLDFGTLKKVASGGELSRIMLSVKAVLAQFKKMPTLIFDEIDTGLSGEVGNKMAEILSNMGQTMQILCITHLPQIAAAGQQHLKIFKEDYNEVTVTKLKLLSKEDRINELAEMIGGKRLTEAAVNHAKELLN